VQRLCFLQSECPCILSVLCDMSPVSALMMSFPGVLINFQTSSLGEISSLSSFEVCVSSSVPVGLAPPRGVRLGGEGREETSRRGHERLPDLQAWVHRGGLVGRPRPGLILSLGASQTAEEKAH
jgi:hypothetical protein